MAPYDVCFVKWASARAKADSLEILRGLNAASFTMLNHSNITYYRILNTCASLPSFALCVFMCPLNPDDESVKPGILEII